MDGIVDEGQAVVTMFLVTARIWHCTYRLQ